MTTINGKKLNEIFNATPTSRAVLKYLLNRDRDRTFIDIRRLHLKIVQEHRIVEQDWDQLWTDLMKNKVGSFVVGRRKQPSRFILDYSLKKFAEAAKEGRDLEIQRVSKRIIPADSLAKKPDAQAPVASVATQTAQDVFILQIPYNGKMATLRVGSDVSREELIQVAQYIQEKFG